MNVASLRRQTALLQTALVKLRPPAPSPVLEAIRLDPAKLLTLAGLAADPWQAQVMRSHSQRILLLCSRQAGKSTTAAGLALRTALLEAGSLTLLLSPTLRQSGELFRDKVLRLFTALGKPIASIRETALTLELANGSRIVALPENEETVRCYSGVRLLVVDEASRVCDPLYLAVRPMLAVSRGRLVALSTPFGKRGFFFSEWESNRPWQRVRITASECPRIAPEFLAEERKALGDRWFNQEYFCTFEDAIDAVFLQADVLAAISSTVRPLFMDEKS